jgi:two-component sensor histidine kinase
VGLADLIRHQLAPYTTDANTAIDGPDVMLTSAQAQAVAMFIHELATNAAKHGALSSPDGRVSVSSEHASTNAAMVLTITWNSSAARRPRPRSDAVMAAASSAIPSLMSLVVPVT